MRMLRTLVVTIVTGLVCVTMAAAQPRPRPGPVPAETPAPGPPTPAVAGQVQQYLLTPHGEVEGLLLTDGTVVKFPPHLGVALASTVRPGDRVSAIGFLGPATSYGRAMKALAITNPTTGQAVVDEPPASRPLPPDLRGLTRVPLAVTGPVTRVLVNPAGDVDGLILGTGEEVRFGPRDGVLVMTLLGGAGGSIAATGYGTRNAFGTVLEAESLTIGTQTIPLAGRGR
jgi:hypothetical protein